MPLARGVRAPSRSLITGLLTLACVSWSQVPLNWLEIILHVYFKRVKADYFLSRYTVLKGFESKRLTTMRHLPIRHLVPGAVVMIPVPRLTANI